MDNILNSIKKMLGIQLSDTSFDEELKIHINSCLAVATQLGIGPETGFAVEDASEQWSDLTDNTTLLSLVRSYVYASVKLIFDPPQNSFLTSSLEKIQKEFEWRVNVQREYLEDEDE